MQTSVSQVLCQSTGPKDPQEAPGMDWRRGVSVTHCCWILATCSCNFLGYTGAAWDHYLLCHLYLTDCPCRCPTLWLGREDNIHFIMRSSAIWSLDVPWLVALPVFHTCCKLYLKSRNPGVLVHTFNPSTLEAEAGGSQARGQPGQYSERLSWKKK
jgi:hypothetical protein